MDFALNRMILKKINKIQDHLLKNNQDSWMSIKDVCAYTGLSSSTIYRSTKKGFLQVSKKTGKNLFRKEWVDRFLGI